ncbi:tetratricopeptide repeat protein [Streptomyces sp. NPDC001093]|uniref:tetratricopeptide repeat protein n=1 Tax=Streptomyces sp. NPDC001093 TaxID=3154376 RepID=UPI00332AB8DD
MSLPGRRPGRALALARARTRATKDTSFPFWPARLAAVLRELDADWRESAAVCADVAWAARAAGNSVRGLWHPDHATTADPDPVSVRTFRHLELSTLRYDFRCATLQQLIDRLSQEERSQLDCYSQALYAFALLGQSRPEALPLMDEVLDEAGDHTKTLHVLMHGLWLGQDLPHGAERLLALSTRPPFDVCTDPIALFRKAGALRRLGRYDASIAAIDQALDLLPPGDALVHADLVRERTLTAVARDLHHHIRLTGAAQT